MMYSVHNNHKEIMPTDFSTWTKKNLEDFARTAADRILVLEADLRAALDAYRQEVAKHG